MKAVWTPTESFVQSTRLHRWMTQLGFDDYDDFFQASVQNIAWFWGEAEKALDIRWFKPYEKVVDLSRGNMWPKWYVRGKLNVTHNAVDKWLEDPRVRTRPAVVWEGEDGKVRSFTYEEIAVRVNRVANGLKKHGIRKGDRIALYMPMIPETVIAILAIIRIGAIFIPCFSGFPADAVAKRLEHAQTSMLMTADGFLRRGKPVRMKEEASKACDRVDSVQKLIVVRHLKLDIPWHPERDTDWLELESGQPDCPCEVTSGDDPFMIIYTSGTTGKPKGAVHTHNGFALKSAFDAGFGMDVKPGDVMCWLTDMGWMMGPFLVFATLFNGATMVIYEGTPNFPTPDRLWKLASDHNLTHLGVSPTLIRSLMPHGADLAHKHDLSTLKAIASTGEPWNSEPWHWLFRDVGNNRIPIINYSGGTEISGGILGNVLVKPIAPASFNAPLPGMDADVFNAEGQPVRGEVGELVIKQPWVGMTNGFWQEPARYENTYWSRWKGTWVHGDWAVRDENDFWVITGRSDDTLNIAGKRLGPAEMESVLVDHPAVLEAATVGIPDNIKGEVAVCFVVLQPDCQPAQHLGEELVQWVTDRMGKALRPKTVHFVADLPKTRNAKIVRRAIRAAYLGESAGDLTSLDNPQAVEAIRQLGHTTK